MNVNRINVRERTQVAGKFIIICMFLIFIIIYPTLIIKTSMPTPVTTTNSTGFSFLNIFGEKQIQVNSDTDKLQCEYVLEQIEKVFNNCTISGGTK